MVGSETSRKGQDFEKIFIPSIGSRRKRVKPATFFVSILLPYRKRQNCPMKTSSQLVAIENPNFIPLTITLLTFFQFGRECFQKSLIKFLFPQVVAGERDQKTTT